MKLNHIFNWIGVILVFFSFSACEKENEVTKVTYGSITDVEGNIYKTIQIGTQTWMAENLKTTKYNDGTTIPLVTDNGAWNDLIAPGYCLYNNDVVNKATYGGLYNWYTVNTGKLAPIGWHVPSDAEWKILEIYLGMTKSEADTNRWRGNDQGISLKSTTGWYNSGNGDNSSGFNAFPGGYRGMGGAFYGFGGNCVWWSSVTGYPGTAWSRGLYFEYSSVCRICGGKQDGYSVRCVKN